MLALTNILLFNDITGMITEQFKQIEKIHDFTLKKTVSFVRQSFTLTNINYETQTIAFAMVLIKHTINQIFRMMTFFMISVLKDFFILLQYYL